MTSHKKFYKVNKANVEIINVYLKYKKTSKAITDRSLRNMKETLKKLADFLKDKSLKNATKEDMIDFFSDDVRVKIPSRDTYANHIIPFYRWVQDLDKHSRPDNMKWFEYTTQRTKRKHIDPNKKEKYLINRDEYNKMLSYQYDRFGQSNAMWELYYLSGVRPEELLKMKVRDLKIEKDNVSITITDSKTIPRTVPLAENPVHLIRYFENHPHKNNPDKPLWFSLKNMDNQLIGDSVRNRFREMKEVLNLKSTLSIKCFRKTRATIMFDNKDFDDTYLGMFFGWTPNTVIMRRQEYNLTNYEDLKNKVCKLPYKVESYDSLKKEKEQLENRYKKELEDLRHDTRILVADLKNINRGLTKKFGKDWMTEIFELDKETVEKARKMAE